MRGPPFGLLFVDVDDFKSVNDNHGHAIGDELLCEVAERINKTIRNSDIAARLGGDEFVILVDNSPDIHALAMRLLAAFHRPFMIANACLNATISIGAALYPDHSGDADILMRAADFAMYRAKAEGRDRLVTAENTPSQTVHPVV